MNSIKKDLKMYPSILDLLMYLKTYQHWLSIIFLLQHAFLKYCAGFQLKKDKNGRE